MTDIAKARRQGRITRHRRVRKKVHGTAERLFDQLSPLLGEELQFLRIGSAEQMVDKMAVRRVLEFPPHLQF